MSVTAEHAAEWGKLQPPKGKGKPTPEQVRAGERHAPSSWPALRLGSERAATVLRPVHDPLSSPVRWVDTQQIAQRKELAAQGETFLKTLSEKLGMKSSDLKKQLNNMLKKAEQEQKQAAKKVTNPRAFPLRVKNTKNVRHDSTREMIRSGS